MQTQPKGCILLLFMKFVNLFEESVGFSECTSVASGGSVLIFRQAQNTLTVGSHTST